MAAGGVVTVGTRSGNPALVSAPYLSIAQGGTNNSSLGSSPAALYYDGSAVSATATGLLPTSYGGTGFSKAQSSGLVYHTSNSDAMSTLSVVPVSEGGTGATSLSGVVIGNGASSALSSQSVLDLSHGGTGTGTPSAGVMYYDSGSSYSSESALSMTRGGLGANLQTASIVPAGGSTGSPSSGTNYCVVYGPNASSCQLLQYNSSGGGANTLVQRDTSGSIVNPTVSATNLIGSSTASSTYRLSKASSSTTSMVFVDAATATCTGTNGATFYSTTLANICGSAFNSSTSNVIMMCAVDAVVSAAGTSTSGAGTVHNIFRGQYKHTTGVVSWSDAIVTEQNFDAILQGTPRDAVIYPLGSAGTTITIDVTGPPAATSDQTFTWFGTFKFTTMIY